MIKFLFTCFVLCLNVDCFLSLTTTTARILTPIYVGCFQSYSSCDVFNETLTLSECTSLANLNTGGWCWSGNCNKTTCTQTECLKPEEQVRVVHVINAAPYIIYYILLS